KTLFRRSPCSGDCRVLRAVVRSSEPPALVSLRSSLCISVVSAEVWRVTDGGYGVLLGFRLRALCSGHQTLALFSTGGLQWVVWGLCKRTAVRFGFRFIALSCRRYSCSLAVVIGSLDLFRMAIGSRVTNSPDCATPEVVYLSSLIVLYGLLVKWVYTVPVDRLEGGNLRQRLLNDGIAGLCHYLVLVVVVSVGLVSVSVLEIFWISFAW
ncbi:unnamed protein product, partial [Brassica rapa]